MKLLTFLLFISLSSFGQDVFKISKKESCSIVSKENYLIDCIAENVTVSISIDITNKSIKIIDKDLSIQNLYIKQINESDLTGKSYIVVDITNGFEYNIKVDTSKKAIIKTDQISINKCNKQLTYSY